jgi:hypothetical protein
MQTTKTLSNQEWAGAQDRILPITIHIQIKPKLLMHFILQNYERTIAVSPASNDIRALRAAPARRSSRLHQYLPANR